MRNILLWVLAVALMAGTVVWQRLTGPTHPLRGRMTVATVKHRYSLVRSATTDAQARVVIPELGRNVNSRIVWRRFPTQEAWCTSDFWTEVKDGVPERVVTLPLQPAAGKLEYYIEIDAPAEPALRLPAQGSVILRYKDPVPGSLLAAHVVLMFFGVLLGLRTGLAAAWEPHRFRALAWATFACLTVGGMVLGPLVQKYAFGALWTGWPFGYDLTDNKTLLMWLVWLVACAVAGLKAGSRERWARWAAGVAALAMALVYLVPHSLRGSQLDYAKVDRGGRPEQAVTTGR